MKNSTKMLKLMLIALLMNTSAHAQTSLDRCDAALKARTEQVSLCEIGLRMRDDAIERQAKEIDKLREENKPSFWDNEVVWAAAGVILGVYIGSRIVR